MFDFWYNKMTKDCPCTFDLAMSDTDSFLFKVDKPDIFWSHIEPHMDFSNYPPNHPKFSLKNKAKLGYFKDELGGSKICKEFVGLRPKCYCLKLEDVESKQTSDKKVCKGLGRTAIKKRLKFEQYKKCLVKGKIRRHDFSTIRSQKHQITTIKQRKKALTHFDSKRYLFCCGIHNVPYGSKLIKKFPNICPYC